MNKKQAILIMASIIIMIVFVLCLNEKEDSSVASFDEHKKEMLLSFINRETVRTIQEPATLSMLNTPQNVTPNDYLVYFVNSKCSFCIGELLSNMPLFEPQYIKDHLYVATNDTIALSYYLNESIGHFENILVTAIEDNDSMTKLNGKIFKIKNQKTVDMIDLNGLFIN